jgi:hypothetical protein
MRDCPAQCGTSGHPGEELKHSIDLLENQDCEVFLARLSKLFFPCIEFEDQVSIMIDGSNIEWKEAKNNYNDWSFNDSKYKKLKSLMIWIFVQINKYTEDSFRLPEEVLIARNWTDIDIESILINLEENFLQI